MGRPTPSALDLGPGLGQMDMLHRGVLCHHYHRAHPTRASILHLQPSFAQLHKFHCTILRIVDTMSPTFPRLVKIRGHTPLRLALTKLSYHLESLW